MSHLPGGFSPRQLDAVDFGALAQCLLTSFPMASAKFYFKVWSVVICLKASGLPYLVSIAGRL